MTPPVEIKPTLGILIRKVWSERECGYFDFEGALTTSNTECIMILRVASEQSHLPGDLKHGLDDWGHTAPS